MSIFSKTILNWYSKNKRALPWRKTRDPYKIWLSEIILQQTRVAQGIPYYQKFITTYPKVALLAAAKESEILKLWQGLGYYSRARNLHFTAKTIQHNFGGNFPKTYNELLELKGIGDYTASAIASICYGEAKPVVDGNVYRVLSRYFGVDIPINSTEGIRYFKQLAFKVMDSSNIRNYNQGIMEFGAIQCTPKNPDCFGCPLNRSCKALELGKVKDWPVKIKKKKVRVRNFNYLVYLDSAGKTRLEKRTGKGIWQHLYHFPLLETEKLLEENEIRKAIPYQNNQLEQLVLWEKDPVIHKLSHQHLKTRFWIAQLKGDLKDGIALEEISEFPVPVLVAEFIDTFKNSYFWPKSIS